MSYTNDIASPEVEIAGEAAGSFFADARNKHSDLKTMLDSNKDSLKMEAMKRIINMIAKGKDASDLFPAVVKNVAVKNAEVKKLVYVYLMRYAEEQQDLALLSISTFQRALKDPNQLIRASALRVLSSIRVPIIVPIMMLCIKESVRDMSPYVRKVAAHAISKLYSLDPELKDQLIEVIDQLLADKTTLVLGSAVHAFEDVCPEMIELIHKHYRKLCQLLVDVDEWGQVVVINMLTRYARTQFEDPNLNDEEGMKDEKFYSSEDDEKSSEEEEAAKDAPKPYVMDPDLRMLLRNTKPLLQSRNSAVVLAVSQLYYHLAPKSDVGLIAKALIRLLRSHREIQSIILTNIATISAKRRNMFEPYLKSFFVRSSDPTHIKLLKLEILTNLATQTNISVILREFQTYVATHDKEFAAATIDAIGRCACNIKEVTDVCLSGLVHLMANKNETVVAQSVVVIKKLLQLQPSEHQDIITQMSKLIDTVKIPAARASIICLIGEYCESCPRVAPDVLRKMAKTFVHEEDYVKLQVLNLGVKLLLTNPQQTEKFVHYVFQLAKYDQSYDLRDRARFLRNLVMPQKPNKFTPFARNIFLTPKPAPTIESSFKDRDEFQLGTLSHLLNQRCYGYKDLPHFPASAPDASVRNHEGYGIPKPTEEKKKVVQPTHAKKAKKVEKFYSDEEEEEEEEEEDEESEEEEEESSAEEEEDEESEEKDEEESSEDEDEDEDEEEEEESSDNEEVPKEAPKPKVQPAKPVQPKPKETKAKPAEAAKTTDLLLDFDFDAPAGNTGQTFPTMAATQALMPTSGGGDAPKTTVIAASVPQTLTLFQTATTQYIPTKMHEMLNKMSGHGLIVTYRFARSPSLFSSKMCAVELKLTNQTGSALENVKFAEKKLHHGMEVQGLSEISSIGVGQSHTMVIGVDFADTTQAVIFDLIVGSGKFPLSLTGPVGEQLQPIVLTPETFKSLQSKLSGMNETVGKISLIGGATALNDIKGFSQKVYEHCNVILITGGPDDKISFAGQTMSGKAPVLITFVKSNVADSDEAKLIVNCEKMVIGSMLFKQLKSVLAKV